MRKQAAVRQDDVLRILKSCDKPMTAYQILEELQSKEPDMAPPTVYRTLTALTDQGRAHRLESIKAFVPCRCTHTASVPVFAICEKCGSVDEQDGSALLPELAPLVSRTAFNAKRHIVEIHGLCSGCGH